MAKRRKLPRLGCRLIFRPWYDDPKTGERIYPKTGKAFPMWVKN